MWSEVKFRANWVWVWQWVQLLGPVIPGQLDEMASKFCLRAEVITEVVAIAVRFRLVRSDDTVPPIDPPAPPPVDPTYPTWN